MRSRFVTLPLSAALGLSLLASCGGSTHHRTVTAGAPVPAGPAPGSVAVGGGAATPAAGSSSSHEWKAVVAPQPNPPVVAAPPDSQPPAPGATAAAATATPTPSPVSVTADRPCVHPGETQGVTVRSEPNGSVVFDTVYADHSDDLTTKYGSGSGSGKTDGTGLFHVTWTIAPNVPAGVATINIGATYQHDIARAATTFVVKPAGEPC